MDSRPPQIRANRVFAELLTKVLISEATTDFGEEKGDGGTKIGTLNVIYLST